MLATDCPFSFVLFGASGHLARIKIFPAFYTLALKKRLPAHYNIVGFARSEMSDASFKQIVADAIRADMLEVNEKVLTEFLSHVLYQQGQYDQKDDFFALAKRLHTLEQECGAQGEKVQPVRLVYLSIPPVAFSDVLENVCTGGVRDPKHPECFRCIVEKPVGHDLKSANAIIQNLQNCFTEQEIYLLDHYMGKDAVRNIYYLRFANPLLERLFKNTLIHHVQITAMEQAGLEGRTGYFEHTGTFLDMFQSHLLIMVSLLTMRLEEAENFRASRHNALEQFYIPPATSLDEVVMQAQYAQGKIGSAVVPGYAEEKGVAKKSRTNTYAALKLMTRTSRWQGVPFYLRSGKRLQKKETRISLQFQEPRPIGPGASPNRLDIILQGEAGMRIHLQTRVGGIDPAYRPLVLEDPLVCVGDCLPEHGLLLLEAIHGQQQWFLSFDEVRTAWRLVDPIQTYLQEAPLYSYAAGSEGPAETDQWIQNDGMSRWF